ncbi:Fanconi anemia group F protein [Megalops cyprinoides]|uniref:Fanconi anemia group F protein n=1 Tax=Megalops cyprinoides TaxID=118141 RepID=UPI001863A757|nr:Fanconi anemia group F protein [Megalops cyprinoides]
MQDVFKNLEGTAQLLAVAQSEFVSCWDDRAVERAFQWTGYCEHIHTRFNENQDIRKALENRLQMINERLRTTFMEYRDLTFSDLAQCQSILLMNLLKNPAISSSVAKLLFDRCRPCMTAGARQSKQSVFDHLAELLRYTSAARLLSHHWKLRNCALTSDPETETQGVLLTERLLRLLSRDDSKRRAEELLDSILQDSQDAMDYMSRILVLAILRDARSTDVTDFMLNWLQNKHCLLQNMCLTLPVSQLTVLAQQSVEFRESYSGILKDWASSLQFDVNEGEWVQKDATGVSFTTLVDHFRSLLEGCPSLKEHTELNLITLKSADGDFDARGLSVWGDLLRKLKR